MKYWFFDGNDVVGPFTIKELIANKGFSATSLICPEEFSDDGDHWQPASLFADVKTILTQNAPEVPEHTATFEEELDSLLRESSPLSFDGTPTDSPSLEIPKKPSKPGPIEDYFNNIKEEDLGNILGIPDPNDNSDMDLAHALEKQLAKTSSTRRRQREEEMAEEQPAEDPKESTHHVATITEVFGALPPVKDDEPPTLPPLPSSTLPVLQSDNTPVLKQAAPATQNTTNTQSSSPQQIFPVADTAPQTVPSTDFAPATQNPTDSQTQAPKTEEEPSIIPDPALLRAEKIEVNSVRARLKQTQEMKNFLSETQTSHLQRQYRAQRKILVLLLAALAIMVALVCVLQFKKRPQASVPAATSTQTTANAYTQELLNEAAPTAPTPAPVLPANQDETQEQKALEIVKNYQLSGNRGTIASYFDRIYQAQLSQGYTAAWEAEPLYKDTYIVKYRLTKTRKEPIIYVFQANVATNKLTGALNNISLDLVGKI